ncbi:MAG: chitin disaccharide deacetylase [Termitinemataceae bacterium]|nr:MAG: chitin disaccharide deacetylase [Termitinemataceae bacterium]
MKLIVNADDFALSEATNHGIVKAFSGGIVRSTTLMANMSAVDHALQLSKLNPLLGIGIHMVLTAGKPLSSPCKTIVDEGGNFYKQLALFEKLEGGGIDTNEVYTEWKAQIEKARSLGFKITHLDSHHHVHLRSELFSTSLKLSAEFKLPIRAGRDEGAYKGKNVNSTNRFSMDFYGNDLSAASLSKIIEPFKNENITLEIMAHPAYIDKTLHSASSYSLQRLDELEILTSAEVKNYIKKNNIELVNYGDIV